MKTGTLELFEIFKKALDNEEDAKTVVKYLEDVSETESIRTIERKMEHLSTKEDLANLEIRLASKQTDLVKWMFLFWIGQFAAMLGIAFAVMKFM